MKTIMLRADAENVEIVDLVHRVGWRSAHFEKLCEELFSTHEPVTSLVTVRYI